MEPAKNDPRASLVEAARKLGGARDLDELIDWLLVAVCRELACEACSISLEDKETRDLLMRSSDPRLRQAGPMRIPRGQGIAGRVFASRIAENVSDAEHDPDHFGGIDRVAGPPRAMMTVPLLDGADCFGVIQVLNPVGRQAFSGEEVWLFEAFAGLLGVTVRRLEAQREAIARAEIDRELRIANNLVRGLLPPTSGEFAGARYRAIWQPSRGVGGDFFLAESLGDGTLLFALCDVCGHGIPAAVEMARVSTVIRSRLSELGAMDLAGWVENLNRGLHGTMQRCQFTGAAFLLLRPDSGEMLVAGHTVPTLWLSTGVVARGLIRRHRALGLRADGPFEAFRFARGEFGGCLMVSDGVLERRNREGEFFGETRAGNSLTVELPNERDFDGFVRAFLEFGGDLEAQDDVTLLWIVANRVDGPHELRFSCEAVVLPRVRAWLEGCLGESGVPEAARGMVVLGFDEILTNLCRHEFGLRPAPARATFRATGTNIEISVAFSRLDAHGCAGKERPVRSGGRGLKVIRRVFASVDRIRSGDEVVITARYDLRT